MYFEALILKNVSLAFAKMNPKNFFSKLNYVIFCNDFWSIIGTFGHHHDPTEWRLFMDSSKVILKAVLLHNGNKSPSVPLAHAANTKESYENRKLILEKIRVKNIIGTFVWVWRSLLFCLVGYKRFCCFCVSGEFRTESIASDCCGLNENRLFQDIKM